MLGVAATHRPEPNETVCRTTPASSSRASAAAICLFTKPMGPAFEWIAMAVRSN